MISPIHLRDEKNKTEETVNIALKMFKKKNRIEAPPSVAKIKRTNSGQRSLSAGDGFVLLD